MPYCSGGGRCLLAAWGRDAPEPEFLVHVLQNARRHGFDELILERDSCGGALQSMDLKSLAVRLEARVAVQSLEQVAAASEPLLVLPGGRFLDTNLLDLTRPFSADGRGRALMARGVGNESCVGAMWLQGNILKDALEHDELMVGALPEGVEVQETKAPCVADLTALEALLLRPAVFFDRDGVLNVDSGYPSRPEDLVWTEGAMEAVRAVNGAGCYAFVVSNQSGIARGYFSEETVCAFHRHMNDGLATQGAHIDEFRHCPHYLDGVVKDLAVRCSCRKPEPGLVLGLAQDWPLDMANSVLVGDKDSDMQAAAAACVEGLRFAGGNLLQALAPRLEAMSRVRGERLRGLGLA